MYPNTSASVMAMLAAHTLHTLLVPLELKLKKDLVYKSVELNIDQALQELWSSAVRDHGDNVHLVEIVLTSLGITVNLIIELPSEDMRGRAFRHCCDLC
jgi:hypothetical protein